MKLYLLNRKQVLPVPVTEAWRFFSSPLNLPAITPRWLNLVARGEVPDRMFPGLIVSYRVTPFFGVPFTWISEITHAEAPHYFVDEQRIGPYRFWHHYHHFRQLDSGTEMTDRVCYSMKHGPFGSLMHALFVKERLIEIFDFRCRALDRLFSPKGAGGGEHEMLQRR